MGDWGDSGRILVGLNCASDLGAHFPQNHVRIRRRWAQVGALGRNLAVAVKNEFPRKFEKNVFTFVNGRSPFPIIFTFLQIPVNQKTKS